MIDLKTEIDKTNSSVEQLFDLEDKILGAITVAILSISILFRMPKLVEIYSKNHARTCKISKFVFGRRQSTRFNA